jgi:Rab GDP dissociation inhibitor
VSKSFGPVSHFEEETQDVIDLYKQITGKDLDLTNLPEELEE